MSVRVKKIPRPQSPMKPLAIIAVKGSSTQQKTLISRKLANFLRYLLIDQDEVVLSSLPTKLTPDLAFQMLLQIASTNIEGAKTGVVINAPFSQYHQIDKLINLKRVTDVRILIIQCLPPAFSDVYRGNEAVMLFVNKSGGFVLDDFLEEMVPLVFPESDLAHELKKPWDAQHFHGFFLSRDSRGQQVSNCSTCSTIIANHQATYQCVECEEHVFHECCCEFDPDHMEKLLRNFAPYLTGQDLSDGFRYGFRNMTACHHCQERNSKGFSPHCFGCFFQTHIESKIMPTVIRQETTHKHVLSIVLAPVERNYTYICRICRSEGKHVGYKCSECCVDFHPLCAVSSPPGSSRPHTGFVRRSVQFLDARRWALKRSYVRH